MACKHDNPDCQTLFVCASHKYARTHADKRERTVYVTTLQTFRLETTTWTHANTLQSVDNKNFSYGTAKLDDSCRCPGEVRGKRIVSVVIKWRPHTAKVALTLGPY